MSSGGDGDRSREHLGVSQTNRAKKKNSRRTIDLEDIPGSISSAPECINHDTHLFDVLFGTADPRACYPNYHRPVDASSISQALPPRHYEDLPLQVIHRARPLSAGRISDGTPSPTDAPRATPDDERPALAPRQKDRLGRVMIESDGSSWNPAKDAAQALKECVRRLFTQAYHFWSEIPNSIRQAMFNEFKYWNTYKFKAMSEQAKKATGSLKGGSLYTRGAKNVGTITREMLGLQGIRSSRQVKALDGVQIVVMSTQIAQLTSALAESERRRVVEQQSMGVTIQQIKEQMLNLTRRPTTSSPVEDTDDDSDKEDDFGDRTP
ncbi:hypothetical protein MTR67_022398 [Solanum verrucosum]|uniref:Uncharacterized protein n=1 Tax=Solanum verrucosum TaxID=315347 RepID=A0AAF0QV98_SOLVR|nr:hypothetical protein MTR67_022398 [Solanum verrucosum]